MSNVHLKAQAQAAALHHDALGPLPLAEQALPKVAPGRRAAPQGMKRSRAFCRPERPLSSGRKCKRGTPPERITLKQRHLYI